MANPKVYSLDGFVDATGNNAVGTFVMWLVAPPNRIVPSPNFKSAVPNLATNSLIATATGVTGATVLSNLQAGIWVEQVASSGETALFANDGVTKLSQAVVAAAFQVIVQNTYATAQAALTASALPFPTPGSIWDGTTWTGGPT